MTASFLSCLQRWCRESSGKYVAGVALMAVLASVGSAAEKSAAPQTANLVSPILHDLRSFTTVGTVLHIGAHPDDENTQLITYFARGRGYRTAYLSLTRGDGGQNEIGPEFDEKLGVARTQELLSARELDGGKQFFTRAIDFGYSKSPEETLTFWDRQQVLGDVVRVIRKFRPDVIVTRFPIPPGSGGHGHHTASAILAVEAFKLAGDPKAYPEQLTQGLTVWQPKRVVWNGFSGGRGGSSALTGPTLQLEIGGYDPVTGETFSAIANRSRARHITQGFGALASRAAQASVQASFVHLGGDQAREDLMDGVDVTWSRYPGGVEIGRLAKAAVEQFKADDPAASIPALLVLRGKLAALPSDPVVTDKRTQLDRILQSCLGLTVATRAPQAEVVPGETLRLAQTVRVTASVPVKWLETRVLYPRQTVAVGRELQAGREMAGEVTVNVPADAPLTHPYWLRAEGSSGVSRVDDPQLIGEAENAPTFPVEYHFEVSGQRLVIADEPIHVIAGPKGDRRRRVDVIPPVSLRFAAEVSVFVPGKAKGVTVDVTAARAGAAGTAQLDLPAGWSVVPKSQAFRLGAVNETASFTFTVTAPAKEASGRVTASADIGGARFAQQRIAIDYPHLPLMLLQPPARARLLSVDVTVRGQNVGYIAGAGDDSVRALEQLGYTVTTLAGADLTAEKLRGLDAVVVGVRAFNERADLAAGLPALFAYVEQGGTVVAQYNRPAGSLPPLGPYALSIAGPAPQLRVTDEKSPVTFLAANHPALTSPNRLSRSDFEGWVQERGAYFPSSWDEARYTPVLAFNDPGEEPLTSGLLVARHGRGYYVYTGIAFFRQLPAGVPGAYRLFANLVSLGK
jgi:LmbE family N-acetylglucosaminyl deacetylase